MSALIAFAAMLAACASRPESPPRVDFPDSAAYELSAATGRRYQLWVDVPADYARSTKDYPVVFVTDPGFAFVTTRTVRNFVGQQGRNIEDFILVGLGPDLDLSGAMGATRRRDYTPSDPLRRPEPDRRRDRLSLNEYTGEAYGEAEAFRRYVEETVFPFVATHYRANMSRTTFIGHSYGGLFGAYVLLTRPTMFENYILGSPSFWFDEGVIFRIEEDYAREHDDLPAKVHMVAGSYETIRPEPRFYKANDLVGGMRRFEEQLKSRGYPGLTISSEVAEGEDHYTVFPDVVSRGLIRLLPGYGPYTSG